MTTKLSKDIVAQCITQSIGELLGNSSARAHLTGDTLLRNIGVDSVMIVSLVIMIEKRFDVFFEDDELMADNFLTIDSVCSFVFDKLSGLE